MVTVTDTGIAIDSYPYTFSPLLLFAQEHYFDKGHSNYNSVAQFFSQVVRVDMLDNVLYERKNMLYDELLDYVTKRRMLVTCCIDSHFTGFQIIGDHSCVYYDPLKPGLSCISGAQSYTKFVAFLLLKCNYGDNQHLVDNKSFYTGPDANATRRTICARADKLWRDINKTELSGLFDVKSKALSLNLDTYLLVNNSRNPRMMSTQPTGSTCYFQTYLFGVLCKVGQICLAPDGASLDVPGEAELADAAFHMSNFLVQFFAHDAGDANATLMMRPLTNSNVVLDFHRYSDAPYYDLIARFLASRGFAMPDYELQYRRLFDYFYQTRKLHAYERFELSATMSSTPNTKSLQPVCDTDEGAYKLGHSAYYKYRAANLMFGFNTGFTKELASFAEFNALRKNQLLGFYEQLQPLLSQCTSARRTSNKYRDYYFMGQFEVGQQELIDVHHYTYEIDLHAILNKAHHDPNLSQRVHAINALLAQHVHFSTQRLDDYDKFMKPEAFMASKKWYEFFKNGFMTVAFFNEFAGLGFSPCVPGEKEINSLTRTAFYLTEMMQRQAWRNEYEFEKECINQMARSTLRQHLSTFGGTQDMSQKYLVAIKIGFGITYSKYNTLMHFLNVSECYWQNPDLNAIQVFGKDIRALLAISCQKIFFEQGHSYYHYGPIEMPSAGYGRNDMDLQVAASTGEAPPSVSREKRGGRHTVLVTERVYEFGYLKGILTGVFERANGVRFKTDDAVLNLSLLSMMLDFGLYEQHAGLLNLPFLKSLSRGSLSDKRQLQVEVSNWINDFDKKNTADSVTRLKVEELIFECSYNFMINKNFSLRSRTFELIQMLQADPVYHQYLLLVKVYVSLCQINKSVEVDYYKIFCNNDYRIIIPQNFSKATSDYLEVVTKRYTFTERGGFVRCGELTLFDVSGGQPEINLYKVRFDAKAGGAQSMVKYIEFSNVFKAVDSIATPRKLGVLERYLIFIADNALNVEVTAEGVTIKINSITVEIASIFVSRAISFVPCFKYADSDDVILFTSRNIHYLVDRAGQFNENYYGMKHELIECIQMDVRLVDLNDEHIFKTFKLSELLTESKTVLYAPDFLLQVHSPQQLINLLDFAIYVRNVSFFILVLLYLRRCSIALDFIEREQKVVKITGPWKAAILYAVNRAANSQYERIFEGEFFDLNQHEALALPAFVDVLCQNFAKYQRQVDGQYQIIPTDKQKAFLQHIITAEACFHFSEVGSGKTKVILPLLCQAFLSNNSDVHNHLARGGQPKHVLVVLVPEHLLPDAKSQVFRYCLNLNFREEYRVHDDIFALLHDDVQLKAANPTKRAHSGSMNGRAPMKQIFITSFNQFKKALTYDKICEKVRPYREHMLVVVDEVDDFLDRDKLVFNICSNKSNAFSKGVLECYFEVSQATYRGEACPDATLASADNPGYWSQLHEKYAAIHLEIQDKSRSINKSFGIFNEQTLRHSATNIAQDIEGYKSLIARPYESVNRAMPGSYYSDVERTIYLTYYILMEDVAKYDELFQQERKFISYEYFQQHVKHLDYDDLVYGNICLSELVVKHPEVKDGLVRFLYEIILRRMEIRDKSRSVNSIDVIFNFDCIGFTGTPFIDNYPTFAYIRRQREDVIPDMIDRSFYAYTSEALSAAQFEERITRFQGKNSNVLVEYVPSDFMTTTSDELAILGRIMSREAPTADGGGDGFNVLVDLCGLVKKTSIYAVRDLVLQHFGADRFHYIYHVDQTDGGDRVLHLDSDNDVQFDEEFYNYLCKTYGAGLRERVLFFVDNRNVIGKDVPFQLIHKKRFNEPLFYKSVIIAHDVDDFSKIWQAMGRSRTMNDTCFTIYKSDMNPAECAPGMRPIREVPLTRRLYVKNCDLRVAGNLSSIYQTLVSLYNLAVDRFYYCDEIVNVFIEKMEKTIAHKVHKHDEGLAREVLGTALPSTILTHILAAKFGKSAISAVNSASLTNHVVRTLLRHIIEQKFDQRVPSGDVHDQYLTYLSGEQEGAMEISYTKQQQKQKAKQTNKNQDADTMEVFDKKHQLVIGREVDNYFEYTLNPANDTAKISLNLPIAVPVFQLAYVIDGQPRRLSLYPTLQFLYSHHIRPEYITSVVKDTLATYDDNAAAFCAGFEQAVTQQQARDAAADAAAGASAGTQQQLDARVLINLVRQNPQYTLAAIRPGVYLIGMKDQFNVYDLPSHPMAAHIQYIADEAGLILYSRNAPGEAAARKRVDEFGPYYVEQYLIMETLSKSEVAQNVLDYYLRRRDQLQQRLDEYREVQGQGFICWRFIHEVRRSPGSIPEA